MGRLQNLIDSQGKTSKGGQINQKNIQALEAWIQKVGADIDELKSKVAALEEIAGGVRNGN